MLTLLLLSLHAENAAENIKIIADPQTSAEQALAIGRTLEQSDPKILPEVFPTLVEKIKAPNTSGADALRLVDFLEQSPHATADRPTVLVNILLKLIALSKESTESHAIKERLQDELKLIPSDKLHVMLFDIIDALQDAHTTQQVTPISVLPPTAQPTISEEASPPHGEDISKSLVINPKGEDIFKSEKVPTGYVAQMLQEKGEALENFTLNWTSPENADEFIPVLAAGKLKNLKSLRIKGGGGPIDISRVRPLAAALQNGAAPRLTKLELPNNGMGSLGATVLANAIRQLPSLTALSLQANKASTPDLIRAIGTLNSLTTLDLSYNFSDRQGLDYKATKGIQTLFTEMAGGHLKNLTTLNLANDSINDEEAQALTVAVGMGGQKITDLNMNYNYIGPLGLQALTNIMGHVTTLSLYGNQLGVEGAQVLANAIVAGKLPSLATLSVGENRLGDKGLTALFNAVSHLTSLTTLQLSSNDMNDAGIQALAKVIAEGKLPSSLKTLSLSGHFVHAESANTLVEAFKTGQSPHLEKLDFQYGHRLTGTEKRKLKADLEAASPGLEVVTIDPDEEVRFRLHGENSSLE